VELLFFYSVGQYKDIVGFADFIERKAGDSTESWNLLGKETCLNSFDEYSRVTRGNKSAIFIRFKNLHQGTDTVALNQIYDVLGIDRMPQTGMYLNKAQAEQLIKLLK
jgi:predicted transcriptional regulator